MRLKRRIEVLEKRQECIVGGHEFKVESVFSSCANVICGRCKKHDCIVDSTVAAPLYEAIRKLNKGELK